MTTITGRAVCCTLLGFRAVGQSPRYAKSLAQEVSGTDVVLTRADWEARQNFVLRTPRLTIRPIEGRDAAGFAALMVPEVARMLSSVTPGMSEAEALADHPAPEMAGLSRLYPDDHRT